MRQITESQYKEVITVISDHKIREAAILQLYFDLLKVPMQPETVEGTTIKTPAVTGRKEKTK